MVQKATGDTDINISIGKGEQCDTGRLYTVSLCVKLSNDSSKHSDQLVDQLPNGYLFCDSYKQHWVHKWALIP